MSQRNLDLLFKPQSIAVIGASIRELRAGNVVMKNLLSGGFSGPIMPVTPRYKAVLGVLAYPNIEALPQVPDLAIICTAALRVPRIVEKLGQHGCKAAVVISGGFDQLCSEDGIELKQQLNDFAKKYGIRILGPNSLGLILPNIGLNASLAHAGTQPGKLAFVSQSAAICTTVLDWANNKGIGFSHFISLGDGINVDFDELLDLLGRDSKTRAIMLYVDSVHQSRDFMSAARAASRNKPILVIKSGRSHEGAIAAELHTGGVTGSDAVYDAAFKRAGMLRVKDLHELFAAVETLAHSNPLKGERLAIVTNGGGPGVLAVDALIERGGKLAKLDEQVIAELDKVLPSNWSRANPVDIIGDATPERYARAVDVLMNSKDIDAVLVMHSPSALAHSGETAEAVISAVKLHPNQRRFNILTNWTGEQAAYEARKLFSAAGLPTYRTPEGAVGAFMHMVEYRRNQKLLMETPQSIPANLPANAQRARDILQRALDKGKSVLETHEMQPVLEAYGLKTIPTWYAKDASEAVETANRIGYPVALKVQSPDIHHKSDVHGVVLNLNSQIEVLQAAQSVTQRVIDRFPTARIDGMIVQKMALTAGAQELRIAVKNDPVFGPAILLGEGGSEWDISRDAAVALPPLNMALARYMVINALKSQKIRDRHLPLGFDIEALCVMLTQVAHLIIDCPEILDIDFNPVLIAGDSITLLDVNVTLQSLEGDPAARLAIRPYPKELEEYFTLRNGNKVLVRPILPEDEPKHRVFDSGLSAEDRYKRYFGERAQMTHEEMALLTQIDYAREMAFVAVACDEHGEGDTLGVVRASTDPDNTDAEFAMVVKGDMQGQGLGRFLLEKLIRYYKANGTQVLMGFTMIQNRGMSELAKKLGFKVTIELEDGLIEMVLPLSDSDAS
ncbi:MULTISPECIES: bifunctional acetate--CoA ligase family protein/GNAT family N-acetyltransferase [unclassified Motilimonas]|uniref:bifunctional acetate--CoA ligase family protein/GNAT family N-acetyltransferase n=1 Tax=Motilimonas TaxID=1914248 RepID=UPI001E412AA4|nr:MULTISPECIES: bifunctional acetate--CoA ligase family protein/GNAT family N-acetyltransferase [unclassified Motilimonas]MCE0557907.1 bifunctional acetate--CoA ligase family protein/GNAT family N-acetyltransferase [Motilimonas sp. E26]MDO6524695.1 bifunctional acetate--CoA ligase family protein/GNAT family N-acetyltransferase [Motilimonas sp. 1_MG-2023]